MTVCWRSEMKSYHAPGTFGTFYGTANSNQMLLEAMACTRQAPPAPAGRGCATS
jgi:dihydroxyacid dehydratase/phosphogluconate dehydratase